MSRLENIERNIERINNDIIEGEIIIPQFQRKFVWTLNKSAKLIDSILKDYPIGTFIFWRTDEELRSVRQIGGKQFAIPHKNYNTYYVLDGQQRITSIYAAVKGITIEEDGKKIDYSNIWIDLDANEDENIVMENMPQISENSERTCIQLTELLSEEFSDILDKYSKEYWKKNRELSQQTKKL